MPEQLDSTTNPNPDPESGKKVLEEHFASWFEHIESDFRSSSLNRLISRLVAPGRILDIGCGSGGLSAILLEQGNEVVSQDISQEMVSMCQSYLARKRLPARNVRLGGVEDITEVAEFDTVIALDVIEHIEDDRRALEIMRRCLKSTGRLVISVPALSRLYGPKDEQIGHYRRYDKPAFVALLQECGFVIESVRFWNFIGVLPVWQSVHRRKRLSEGFRYSGRSALQQFVNRVLRGWFVYVENVVSMPIGLTLIACAKLSPPIPQVKLDANGLAITAITERALASAI